MEKNGGGHIGIHNSYFSPSTGYIVTVTVRMQGGFAETNCIGESNKYILLKRMQVQNYRGGGGGEGQTEDRTKWF